MPTDKKLDKLVINNLTEEQYKNAVKNEDELYLTPDTTEETLDNLEKNTPTDIGIKNNKLGLLHDTKWLTNQGAINLEGFTYDESTNTLKSSGAGSSIPVVEGTITNEYSFILNAIPTQDYFLAHLLYPGTTIYVNSLMSKTTITFGNKTDMLYIGLMDLQCTPFLAFTTVSDDGSIINTLKQISFMNSAYQSNGIIYLTNDGFNSLEYGESGTYLKSTGDGVVWDTLSSSESGNDIKTISLFGNHSILVPSDSSDTNIDLYHHNMVMKNASGSMQLFLSYTSSSNLVVDSFTDLNTLLGTTKRFIPCSGYSSPTSEGCPCIQAIDWQGAYASSKFITNTSASGGLSNFTVITDDVTTL